MKELDDGFSICNWCRGYIDTYSSEWCDECKQCIYCCECAIAPDAKYSLHIVGKESKAKDLALLRKVLKDTASMNIRVTELRDIKRASGVVLAGLTMDEAFDIADQIAYTIPVFNVGIAPEDF